MAVAGVLRHWAIRGCFRAAGCVAGMWVDRKDAELTSLWLEAEGSVYLSVYQGRKYMKNKGSLLITNQPLYQLS